ncbi:hypothetical protein NQ176_g752 [Zarea fungicola]|uniref:Uncharacterized protein n=1 Tax=Zarea fungicola TaxID=93591 RepID=A0ACC1NWS5_9HYPO|nr:hypothetical protein NQ176_g752 [Lecanicillium fungicola]
MLLTNTLALSLVGMCLASPLVVIQSEPPANATFIPCEEGTKDPICLLVKQPLRDIITERTHPNGTVEILRNLYTREQLKHIRERNKVVSVEVLPGQNIGNGSAEFVQSLAKREGPPPICTHEIQKWYDTANWGYWYQNWHQVGNCFYCDQCTESINVSFGVSQTWTWGLDAKFADVINVSFGFQWGQTFTLSDTRTCQWSKGDEKGCHSIWYQPLMTYHNGNANYQTHTHCPARLGSPASDTYTDHYWTGANVNQGGKNGVNQGNLGCNSGCGGSDHRQCTNGNTGGSLWPYAN